MPAGIFFTDEFIPVMEQALFLDPGEKRVLHQFVQEIESFGTHLGDTIRVMGFKLLDPVSDPDTERSLASITSKVSDIAEQHLEMFKQEFTMNEFLLRSALMVTEYEGMHALHDIAAANGTAVAQDYHEWRERMIAKRMTTSSFSRFAGDASSLATMDKTDKIGLSELIKSKAIIEKRSIPTYPNGNYVCLIDSAIEATLLEETKFLEATTRGLGKDAPIWKGVVTEVAGLTFVKTNQLGTLIADADGSSGGPFDASQALIFGTSTMGGFPLNASNLDQDQIDWLKGMGAGPVTKVTGMRPEIRLSEVTDYQRFQKMIWIEHSGYSVLDPNVNEVSGKVVGTDSRFIEKVIGATLLS